MTFLFINLLLKRMKKLKPKYIGRETENALENFPISLLKPDPVYVQSVVIIKKAAAKVNYRLGLLDKTKSTAIVRVCEEILSGKLAEQFVVDPFQAGAGTSLNMNVNEVIAGRASESGISLHPNDDVNLSQSTNDVIPTAIRLTVLKLLPLLIIEIRQTQKKLESLTQEFRNIVKSGRTHLRDALPVTLGQEFGSYAAAIDHDLQRLETAGSKMHKIGIGGTAVGTGINTPPEYHRQMVSELSGQIGLQLKSSGNLLESSNNTADFLEISGSLRILSQTLVRIGNDLRLLSSGPGTGLAEIRLPKVQAGSSIMPGKINPSIVEMLTMVCFQVIGFDQAMLLATVSGQLELNVWLPLISHNLTQQLRLITNALGIFNKKCLAGIRANEEMCQYWFERSSGVAAVLNPYLGYDMVATLVKHSLSTDKSLKQLIIEKKLMKKELVDKIFSVNNLTRPNLSSPKIYNTT